jgi:hypothetical protein
MMIRKKLPLFFEFTTKAAASSGTRGLGKIAWEKWEDLTTLNLDIFEKPILHIKKLRNVEVLEVAERQRI